MMKKRRRAYKKYDWRAHCLKLINNQLERAFNEMVSKHIELALLYGEDNVVLEEGETTVSAGVWKITIPILIPHLKTLSK